MLSTPQEIQLFRNRELQKVPPISPRNPNEHFTVTVSTPRSKQPSGHLLVIPPAPYKTLTVENANQNFRIEKKQTLGAGLIKTSSSHP
jgi:hypothetical protein